MNLKARLDETLAEISGKSSLADAIRYTTSRWLSMTRFTTDGRLEICNNAAERAMRPIAVGRHNWTVAGSDAGGERAALMYTLIETAKLNGLDPEAYLARSFRASPIIRAGGSQNCSPGYREPNPLIAIDHVHAHQRGHCVSQPKRVYYRTLTGISADGSPVRSGWVCRPS